MSNLTKLLVFSDKIMEVFEYEYLEKKFYSGDKKMSRRESRNLKEARKLAFQLARGNYKIKGEETLPNVIVGKKNLRRINRQVYGILNEWLECLEDNPDLNPVIKDWDDLKRLRTHSYCANNPGEKIKFQTYGIVAPTFLSGFELIQGLPENPRVLMLGAYTPIAVKQTETFLSKICSPRICVADNDPGALKFIEAYGLDVETELLDFTEKGAKLPKHDVAIGDHTLRYLREIEQVSDNPDPIRIHHSIMRMFANLQSSESLATILIDPIRDVKHFGDMGAFRGSDPKISDGPIFKFNINPSLEMLALKNYDSTLMMPNYATCSLVLQYH